ncbi:hypothetical protein L6278_01725 [Candidatus Parcubacteria bacterium]|nr:hypothetical protein [Patescibacteria group bacterium]MBU4481919.1 hypothetical protein [Patescibacteria group bacterium]MCG2686841.1 hypothetical protein [Candidatus Parcubacteria bacterium]
MPVQIKRKPKENMYSLLRRFQDVFRKSRVNILARQNASFFKPLTKRQIKKDALRRKYNRERRQYLMRIGKISDEPIGGQKQIKGERK